MQPTQDNQEVKYTTINFQSGPSSTVPVISSIPIINLPLCSTDKNSPTSGRCTCPAGKTKVTLKGPVYYCEDNVNMKNAQ